jgi:hypothetical protein
MLEGLTETKHCEWVEDNQTGACLHVHVIETEGYHKKALRKYARKRINLAFFLYVIGHDWCLSLIN